MFFTNYSAADKVFNLINVNENQKNQLWNDPKYGWKNFSTLVPWMAIGRLGYDCGSTKIL